MATLDSKLIGKNEIAEGTMEFIFEKPKDLEMRAGQFLDVIIPGGGEHPDHAHIHGFSFVNAAFENEVVIATRMRNTPYKNAIKALPNGTPVKLIAPFGDFTLQKNESVPAVFIIGGIGITPARSMIAQATHDKTNHKITLLYANRTPAQAAYTDGLKQLAKQNPNFTFVPVYTDVDTGEVGAETGRINEAIINRHVPSLITPKFYLAGPEGMVKAMRALLVKMGADEDNIRTEEFEGY